METKIKDFYKNAYPTDRIWKELNPEATFQGLLDCLDCHNNVYSYINVYDIIVRERLFEHLSNIMGVDYNYIYEQWLLEEIKDGKEWNIQ